MAAKRPPNVTETLPDGTVIEFYDEIGVNGEPQQRRYICNGERYANVTTILNVLAKEALLGWVYHLTLEGLKYWEVRDEASERGQDSHHLLLQLLTGAGATLADLPDDYRPYGQAGFRWFRERQPEVLECERMVASTEHRYAGRLDLFARLACAHLGTPPHPACLVDFKTLTKWSYKRDQLLPPYGENLLQLDLYQGARIECGLEPAERGLIVRLGPDASYDETLVDLDPERGVAILNAYRARAAAEKHLREAAKAQHVRRETDAQIAEAMKAS